MTKPTLSIIILSYNTCQITLDCLKSLKNDQGLGKIGTEIIVVDNASTDASVKELKKNKDIKLIANTANVGFAAGNNQALAVAQGNFILFLNSDTIIHHWAISTSVDWLSSHPEASACTVQLLNTDGSIQATGGFFPNLLNIFTWSVGLDDLPLVNRLVPPFHPHQPNFYTHDRFYLTNHRQDWLTGAFLLTRQSILAKVGGFDPDYFMYGEEVELCYRIKKAFPTLSMYYLVNAQITHLGGASTNYKADIITKANQGILAFFQKHRPSWQYHLAVLILKINVFLRLTVYRLFKIKNYVTTA